MASFGRGRLLQEWKTYVDPEDYFDPFNVSIHGIDNAKVRNAPTLAAIGDQVFGWLHRRIIVCHTHFDRAAIQDAFDKYGLCTPTCTWLDSARVARRTWKQFASKGYGLGSICAALGYEFTHHDALEDAKAAAHIVLAAVEETDLDVQGWLKRVEEPIDPSKSIVARCGNPQGPLFGEVLVFTGTLSATRCQAAEIAANAGCCVDAGVTKHTTILVIGDQAIFKLAGYTKSSKHRKAEELIRQGKPIQIIPEAGFWRLVSRLRES